MQRSSVWVLTFVLGTFGGVMLATGVYTATASDDASRNGATDTGLSGGVRILGADPTRIQPGHWIVSDGGALKWVADDSAQNAVPDAKYLGERRRAIADVQREIECQISSCDEP
jgi:hypothetical protein